MAACVVLIVVSIVLDIRNKNEIEKLEAFLERYNKIEAAASGGNTAPEENPETAGLPAEENTLTGEASAEETPEEGAESVEDLNDFAAELNDFAKSASNYPAAKAWSVLGGIYASQGKWEEAETAYLKSAGTGKKAPAGAVSLFNAAVCAENLGKPDAAIERYVKASAIPDFSQAAHARFAAGALYEAQNKIEEAKEAYQAVIDNFSEKENDWSSLANSRLIVLELTDSEQGAGE